MLVAKRVRRVKRVRGVEKGKEIRREKGSPGWKD
jgi:hypothetical protein